MFSDAWFLLVSSLMCLGVGGSKGDGSLITSRRFYHLLDVLPVVPIAQGGASVRGTVVPERPTSRAELKKRRRRKLATYVLPIIQTATSSIERQCYHYHYYTLEMLREQTGCCKFLLGRGFFLLASKS